MAKWTPRLSDYTAVLTSQNPWHQTGTVPNEYAPNTYRQLANVLWQSLLENDIRRHQIILGPRRVGKTTVMYQTVRELLSQGIKPGRLWWLRLDHPLLLDTSLGDLVSQICTDTDATPDDPVFIFLDELTFAKNWELWLKTFHDEHWPVRIVGTSSVTAAFQKKGVESGTGRWIEQYLAPYLFTEYLELLSTSVTIPSCEPTLGETISRVIDEELSFVGLAEKRRRFLLTGGFPELLLSQQATDEASELLRSQRVLKSDAIEKAIYMDIPQAFSINDPAKLERLLYVLAGQMTGVFSPSSVSQDIALSASTIEKYVGFLERAFIIFLLPNYSSSEETVQRRGKKVFFVDGAVRNAALLRGAAPIDDHSERGMLVENMAASHLRALAYQDGVRLYHWRKGNHEVDFVYDDPRNPVAFEMTVSRSHRQQGLKAFQKKFPKFRGSCYVVSKNEKLRQPTFDSPGMLPIDLFLVIVGAQSQHAMQNRFGSAGQSPDDQGLLF